MRLKHKNLEIRLANINDADYLLKYWTESGWDITLKEAQERLTKNREQHMIEVDGRIIGDIHYGELENNTAEIGIYIRDEREKGKGYGLSTTCIYIDALIKFMGYDKIRIATSVDNDAMRHISETKLNLSPTIHTDAYQEQLGTHEPYVEYILEKENWQNNICYEFLDS